MYKLMAIDLDGTLLNSYGVISDEDKNSINMAMQKGVEIVLCSGRASSSIEKFAQEIGTDKYLISGNGALVYDIKKQESIYENYMDKNKILNIINMCEENSIYYNIYTEGTIIAKTLNYNVLFYHNENIKKTEEKKTHINIVEDVYKYVENSDFNKFLKVTICDNDKIVFSSIIKKLRQIKGIDVLDVAHMSRKMIKSGTQDVSIEYYYTEIMSKNTNKWSAIENLINKIGIQKEQVVAIGDNINDKEMIQNAGLGVVMGNSAPYIKEIADVVVNDNNSNGVSEAIKKYVIEL